jgi:hypothetical protein
MEEWRMAWHEWYALSEAKGVASKQANSRPSEYIRVVPPDLACSTVVAAGGTVITLRWSFRTGTAHHQQ